MTGIQGNVHQQAIATAKVNKGLEGDKAFPLPLLLPQEDEWKAMLRQMLRAKQPRLPTRNTGLHVGSHQKAFTSETTSFSCKDRKRNKSHGYRHHKGDTDPPSPSTCMRLSLAESRNAVKLD
ncbi:hypothetical protein E2C01_012350 [Portunus trituberculatus]|uniref:Uncharacterized protein n=1 Tax=Portunus trituberculatus TaxID=210409 RepID=A0A5B7DEE6_PORTR|nr:hypothetical protein [Portunus trituberculatus]